MTTVTKLYGADWCGDTRRARAYLDEHHVDYEWIDIEADPKQKQIAREISGSEHIPVVVFDDGDVLVEPTNEQLKHKLSL